MIIPTALGKIEGYCVNKGARGLRIGDIIIRNGHFHTIKRIERSEGEVVIKTDFGSYKYSGNCRFACIQKEDPIILITIDKNIDIKLEILKKHKKISKATRFGWPVLGHIFLDEWEELPHLIEGRHCFLDSEEDNYHYWRIRETSGEHEYWEDVLNAIMVLWKGNQIIAWRSDTDWFSRKPLIAKDKTVVLAGYDLPKNIWK